MTAPTVEKSVLSPAFWIYYGADKQLFFRSISGGLGMKTGSKWTHAALIALVLIAGAAIYPLTALQTPQTQLGYIQGTVRSSTGTEAGVWGIAEPTALATGFIQSVVTNDQGRYVLPELPMGANYNVWVRGYGLADSNEV